MELEELEKRLFEAMNQKFEELKVDLENVKPKKESKKSVNKVEKVKCIGKTKTGKICTKNANTPESYCSAHLKIKEKKQSDTDRIPEDSEIEEKIQEHNEIQKEKTKNFKKKLVDSKKRQEEMADTDVVIDISDKEKIHAAINSVKKHKGPDNKNTPENSSDSE
jgi:hypothetical protein